MKKVKFSVMCNAIYYGELMVDDNIPNEDILGEIQNRLEEVPVQELEWLRDLDPEVAVTENDILYIQEESEEEENERI